MQWLSDVVELKRFGHGAAWIFVCLYTLVTCPWCVPHHLPSESRLGLMMF